MSQVTIPDLTPNPGLIGGAVFEISQSGSSFKSTLDEIISFGDLWTGNQDAAGFNILNLGINSFGAITTPNTPASGTGLLYSKDIGGGILNPFWLDFGGTEFNLLDTGGDVDGPGVSIVNQIATWNDTTGTLLAANLIEIDGSQNVTNIRSLQFTGSGSFPAFTSTWIQADASGDLVLNVDTLDSIFFGFGGPTQYTFSPTDFTLNNHNIVLGTGYVDFTETTTPAQPSGNQGRLYAKPGTSTFSTPFWLDDNNDEFDLLDTGGDVDGPGLSIVNQIPTWNDTTGTLLAASTVQIDSSANISLIRSLQFAGDNSFPVGGITYLQTDTNEDLRINLPTGGNFQITFNSINSSGIFIDETGIDTFDKQIRVDEGSIQFEDTGIPSTPGLNFGELYADGVGGGVAHIFWIDNDGTPVDLVAHAEGDVVGPGSSTQDALVRWDNTTGTLVADSGILLDGSNNLTGITALTLSSVINFPDGVRQIFNPDVTNSGLNVGAVAGEPSSPVNGDIIYDSNAAVAKIFAGGSWMALGPSDQTPWVSDIDGDDFFLFDVSSVKFNAATAKVPGNDENAIWADGTGTMINVPDTDLLDIRVNGVTEYEFDASALDTKDNSIILNTVIPSLSGKIRLANLDKISWRNGGDDGDLGFFVDGADNYTFEENVRILSTGQVGYSTNRTVAVGDGGIIAHYRAFALDGLATTQAYASANLIMESDVDGDEQGGFEILLMEGGITNQEYAHFNLGGNNLIDFFRPITIPTNTKIFLDGGIDTSLRESSGNTITMEIGGADAIQFTNVGTAEPTITLLDGGNDYSIGRLSSGGFLNFIGIQSGFSGFNFETNLSSVQTRQLTIENDGDVIMRDGNELFFDGVDGTGKLNAGDSSIRQSSANVIAVKVGGSDTLTVGGTVSRFIGTNLEIVKTAARPDLTLIDNTDVIGTNIGQMLFQADDDGGNPTNYGLINSVIRENADGIEEGELLVRTRIPGGIFAGLEIEGQNLRASISPQLDFAVSPTKKIFVDAGANTSIRESSADVMTLEAGGTDHLSINGTSNTAIFLTGTTVKNSETVTFANWIGTRNESGLTAGNAVAKYWGNGFNSLDAEVNYGNLTFSVRDNTATTHDGDFALNVWQAGGIIAALQTVTTISQIQVAPQWQLLFQNGSDHIRGQNTALSPATNANLLEMVGFGNNTVTTDESIQYARILLRIGSNVDGAEGGKILFSTADSAASGALTTAFEIQGQSSRVAYTYSIFMQDIIDMNGENISNADLITCNDLHVLDSTLNQSVVMELGNSNASSTTALAALDFQVNGGDFDARIIRNADTDGPFDLNQEGTGDIRIRFAGVNGYLFNENDATFEGNLIMDGHNLQEAQGADEVAGDIITLDGDGNAYIITGTGTINHMTTTGFQTGTMIVLFFPDGPTVNSTSGSPPGGTADFMLDGDSNVNFGVNSSITVSLIDDGTNTFWREEGRSG